MASSSWQKLIFIALIVAIAVPNSTAHRNRRRSRRRSDDTEQNLRDLCSETDKSDLCWNILKANLHKFDNSDDTDIADGIIDLAVEKSKAIGDQLNQWFRDSNDDKMKDKYRSCSKNYYDINRNLKEARRNLDSNNNRRISDQVDDAEEELEKCKREFGNSFDPGHVGDRNNEIGVYLEMVQAASNRLEDYYDDHE